MKLLGKVITDFKAYNRVYKQNQELKSELQKMEDLSLMAQFKVNLMEYTYLKLMMEMRKFQSSLRAYCQIYLQRIRGLLWKESILRMNYLLL